MSDQPIDRVLSRLARVSRTSGDGFMACCPAHEDKNPSLSIRAAENGTVLLHCHAGCSFHAIVDALGIESRAL